jgi:hypothetical protein
MGQRLSPIRGGIGVRIASSGMIGASSVNVKATPKGTIKNPVYTPPRIPGSITVKKGAHKPRG